MINNKKNLSFFLVLCFSILLFAFGANASHDVCNTYTSENACQDGNCFWETAGSNSWCEGLNCYAADGTNQTYCENLNETYSLSFACEWQNGSSQEECEPLGGDYFGNACTDFTVQADCQSSWFCNWNSTSSACENDESFNEANIQNPSCGIVNSDATMCTNISGCTYDSANLACSGHESDSGISCSDINQTQCSQVTFLSSCCNWNGSICGVSFDSSCYNDVPALTIGQTYCEDSGAYKNETVCNKLAGSPWYMPCSFNQSGKEECHFNTEAYGEGSGSFDEVGSETACTSQGGLWKTEQYTNAGVEKTDSWCEFDFGNGGNCDASCWACEGDSSVTSLATAESVCAASDLGYCEFREDSNANNGYGWCNPKQNFIDGGGKNCDDECSACDYLNSPENACSDSFKGCIFVNDSSANNGVGNCFGKSESYCGNDCFSCYTQDGCTSDGKGGNGACTWDATSFICKTAGFSGEVCFDGKDNDNDALIDCSDPGCATNKFCGGTELSETFGDCHGFFGSGANESCIDSGCVWVKDNFDDQFGGENGGHCDYPGAQCWIKDDSQSECNAESGCSWTSGSGFCMENSTLFDTCFTINNSGTCDSTANCGWRNDSYNPSGGSCEPTMMSQCFGNDTRRTSESACIEQVGGVTVCGWTNDSYSPEGGYCDPVCFGLAGNAGACETPTSGLCEVRAGYCEPDSFGGKCYEGDGNVTMCTGSLNQTCGWTADQNALNNVSGTNCTVGGAPGATDSCGWCNAKGGHGFVSFMGDVEPQKLGVDEASNLNDTWDLHSIMLRDDFDRFVFGTRTQDRFNGSAICNNIPLFDNSLGSGAVNHTFFWYLDSDGNTTNNCAARDNSSATGYEFSFKYQGLYGASLTETKVSYRCFNGSWGPVPIPLTSNIQKMCGLIGGGMAGVDKSELFKFKNLFNKSSDLRIYSTVSNITSNDSYIVDVAGPFYYSQGSIDFKFEDCSNSGGDADGDGLIASNDPDCMDFLKFGYVPVETGFQCSDGVDNDADGLTDCADNGCSFSFECGGSGVPVADSTDNKAPKVTWLNVQSFPDSAFIMYDTNEPANGTIDFYNVDATCATINKTVRDNGIIDSFLPAFKMWHDGPLDDFNFNTDALDSKLPNGTSFYYKTNVCDVNNNCAVSACLNFTTKGSSANCKSCSSTFNFPFSPPSGAVASDPLGVLNFTIIQPDGSTSLLGANAASGTQLNYSQTKNFDLVIENKDSKESNWTIRLVNASITGKISSGISNFSSSDGDIGHNSTDNGTFIGLGNTKCQELINTFRPKKLWIGIPGNVSDLYQCGAGLQNCTLKSIGTNATLVLYNTTTNVTTWEVPAEWGC